MPPTSRTTPARCSDGAFHRSANTATPTPELPGRLAANQVDGLTSVTIQRAYSLTDTPSALADFANGTLGKLVVDLDGDGVPDGP